MQGERSTHSPQGEAGIQQGETGSSNAARGASLAPVAGVAPGAGECAGAGSAAQPSSAISRSAFSRSVEAAISRSISAWTILPAAVLQVAASGARESGS